MQPDQSEPPANEDEPAGAQQKIRPSMRVARSRLRWPATRILEMRFVPLQAHIDARPGSSTWRTSWRARSSRPLARYAREVQVVEAEEYLKRLAKARCSHRESLVPLSELADRSVREPLSVVAIGEARAGARVAQGEPARRCSRRGQPLWSPAP